MAIRLSRLFVTCLLTAVAFLGCGGGGGGGESVAAPSGLQAQWSETEAGALRLSWNPSPGDVQNYRIEYRLGTGEFTLVSPGGTLPASTTSTNIYFDTAVLPEVTPLDFRVCALKNGSKSPFSGLASLTTRLRSPGRPTVDRWVGGLRVTWTNPSTAADTIILDRGVASNYTMADISWTRVTTLQAGALQYIDLDAPENAYVSYRVANAKGEATTVSPTSYYVQTSLQGPLGLTATGGTERVRLAWTNRSPSAASVVVTRYAGFNSNAYFTDIAVLPPTATTYEDTGVPTGYYTYRVEARKAGATSGSPSEEVEVATVPVSSSGLVLQPSIESMPNSALGGLDRNGQWVLPSSYGATNSGILTGSGESWAWHNLGGPFQIYLPGVMWDAAVRPHMVIGQTLMSGSPLMVIRHVWHDGLNWQSEEITRTELGFGFGSTQYAKLDASGNPVFLFQSAEDSTTGVRLAMKMAGGWQVEAVAPGWTQAPQHLSLTLDGSGTPVVLAGFDTTLQLLRRAGAGAWVEEAVPQDLNGGYFGGMDLLATSDGDLHILACRWIPGGGGKGQILGARRTSGGWTPVTVIHAHASYSGEYALCHVSPAGDQIAVGYTSSAGTWLLSYRQGAWSSALLGREAHFLPFVGFTPEGKLRVMQNTAWFRDVGFAQYIVFREP